MINRIKGNAKFRVKIQVTNLSAQFQNLPISHTYEVTDEYLKVIFPNKHTPLGLFVLLVATVYH